MKLLCVTINYKTPDLTMMAVEKLVPELEGVDAKVIVVDNDSQDDSLERMRATHAEKGWGDLVEILDSGRNGGFGYGNNFAIRRAKDEGRDPEYVYLLNSDAFPHKGCIKVMLDFMDKNTTVGSVGGYVEGEDGHPHYTAFRFHNLASEFEMYIRFKPVSKIFSSHSVSILPLPNEPTEVDWVSGASLMFRSAMLEEVGLFDETYFLYFEETDLSRRAKEHGWTTYYLPNAGVTHIGSASTQTYRTKSRRANYWFDSRRYYFRKHHGRAYAEAADATFLAAQGLWNLRRILEKKDQRDPDFFVRDFLRHKLGLPRAP